MFHSKAERTRPMTRPRWHVRGCSVCVSAGPRPHRGGVALPGRSGMVLMYLPGLSRCLSGVMSVRGSTPRPEAVPL